MRQRLSNRTPPVLYVSAPVNALVEGIYQEDVPVSRLLEHGDLGIGTFNNLDGEMGVVDGIVYQIDGDGLVRTVPGDTLTPYACVTFFRPLIYDDLHLPLPASHFAPFLERLIPSPNLVYALRIDGEFDHVRVRSVPPQENYRPLIEVTRDQPEFEFTGMTGTLAGFFTPAFLSDITVPGFHLHFLSEDRTAGGHLLECSVRRARFYVQNLAGINLRLPYTLDYFTADLTQNRSDELEEIEH